MDILLISVVVQTKNELQTRQKLQNTLISRNTENYVVSSSSAL